MTPRLLYEMARIRLHYGRHIKHLYAEQGRVSVDFSYSRLDDLTRLRGMHLHHLGLYGTPITEWSELANLDFRQLNVGGTTFCDLSALASKPLTSLEMYRTGVSTLHGLEQMPLTFLQVGETCIRDFAPLSGLPLERLLMLYCPTNDLSFLDGMNLALFGFTFNNETTGVDFLRRMSKLERIYATEYDSFTPTEFFDRFERRLPLDEKRQEMQSHE